MAKKYILTSGALTAVLVFSAFSGAQADIAHFSYDKPIRDASSFVQTAGKNPVSSDSEAQISKGAETFIDSMGKRAIGFLSNASLSKDQKAREFRKLLSDSFDLKTIGRFSLGRYWKAASPAQIQEYQNLFEDLVVEVYAQRFDEYQGQNLDVRSSRMEGTKDAIVQSFIVDKSGTEFSVDWRVRYKDGRYKIVDVIIEGVSMTLTQRSDFSSVIQRGGGNVDVLIAHLKGQN